VSRPITGVTATETSTVIVRVHWALDRDAPVDRAMLGIRGAPRLLVMAPTRVIAISPAATTRSLRWLRRLASTSLTPFTALMRS
jgi:hypothetical protein